MTEVELMRAAIRAAADGVARGQSPFGASIAKNGQLITAAHNVVWLTTDPTAHAEINCIRQAAQEVKTINFSGYVMYATTEPCPMCLAAIHWAKFDCVVYGATIADAAAAGFTELCIPAKDMVRQGGSKLIVRDGLLVDECRALFDQWRRAGGKPY